MEKDLVLVNNNDEVMTGLTVATDDGMSMILDLTQPRTKSFCSVNVEKLTEEQEIDFFNAINSTEHQLSDSINTVIEVKDVYCEIVTLTDEETGVQSVAPRTVLIDKDGVGYGCCSKGVFGSLTKLFAMCGTPQTWKAPKKLLVKQIKKGKNSILTLQLSK